MQVGGLKRFLYFLIGLLLYPASWLFACTAWLLLGHLQGDHSGLSPGLWWMLGGFVFEVVLFCTLPKPVRTYVLAHGLTHALWGLMMGARVGNLKVSKEGGSVSVSRTNFLIVLAPYFFPFYTVLVIPAYFLLNLWVDVTDYEYFWLALIGFTWAFHLCFTVMALSEHQPDIDVYGRVFSYGVIALVNLGGVCLWIVAVSSATMGDLGLTLQEEALSMWEGIRGLAENWRKSG